MYEVDLVRRVSSNLLVDGHLISYSLERDLLPLLQTHANQSLRYGSGERIEYNWKGIEQHLIDRILHDKPLIELELRQFAFAGEPRMAGAISNLRHRVEQTPIGAEERQQLLGELQTLQNIRKAKSLVEICVGFLSTSSSHEMHASSISQLSLVSYIRDTLLLESEFLEITGLSAFKRLQLQHLHSLWDLLEEKLHVDPFENVAPKYRQQMPLSLAQILKESVHQMGEPASLILSLWRHLILTSLTDSTAYLNEELSVKFNLSFLLEENGYEADSLVWFQAFPDDLRLKHSLDAFRFFENVVQNSS